MQFWAEWNQSGLCSDVSDCVTSGFGDKILFGSGTKLHINDSKLNSFHFVVKSDCRKCSGVNTQTGSNIHSNRKLIINKSQ